MNSIGNPFHDVGDLKVFLESHGVDTTLYGNGEAKTIEHLLKEIQDKESILIVSETGKLLRQLNVLNIDISYSGKILREDKQIFKDGRVRQRSHLVSSLSEKIKNGEDEVEGLKRAVQEELGIILESYQIPQDAKIKEQTTESQSFPGIQSVYKIKIFTVMLNNKQFNPEGYIEHQVDKDTYFVWK